VKIKHIQEAAAGRAH